MNSTYNDAVASTAGIIAILIWWVICLAISIFMIVAMWKVYQKAGKPGWGSIVPFYSNYLMFEMGFGNGWLFLLTLIPCVGAIVMIVLWFKLASAFGKGAGYGVGLWLLPIVFWPMLAFGDAEYIGPQ